MWWLKEELPEANKDLTAFLKWNKVKMRQHKTLQNWSEMAVKGMPIAKTEK